MKYYVALILFIFIGCAAQMAPKGGPIDKEGPILLKISHSLESKISNTDDKIIFYFNEFINPLTVVNAIEVLNFNDFGYQIRGKNIIISPNDKWPDSQIIKINISRKISDFHDNIMNASIQLSFSTSITKLNNKIIGSVIDTHGGLFKIRLYQLVDNHYELIDQTESNIEGLFEFTYLEDGQYIAVAVENSIDFLSDDITTKRYGFISHNFIDLINYDSTSVSIKISNPLERLEIKSFRQINNNFGYVMLNNGTEKQFIIPSDAQPGDSLEIIIKLNNRIEDYSPAGFEIILNNLVDTLPPKIDSYNYLNKKLQILFDEPISRGLKSPNIYYKLDSIVHQIDYHFINSFLIQIDSTINSDLYIENIHDIYSNRLNDTLSIINQLIEDTDKNILGGNIYGSIQYEGAYPIIVRAESMDLKHTYYNYLDSLNQFYFLNIKPGFYNFMAYEILENYDSTQYYSGSWDPFKRAAKFGIYNETLEVRNHWDIKDMIIKIK